MAVAPYLPNSPWIQRPLFNPPVLPHNFYFNENGNQWGQDRNGISPAQSWNVPTNQMQQPYQVAQTSSNQMMDSNQLMQSQANQGMQQSSTNHGRQQLSTNKDSQSSTNEMDQRDNSNQSELTVQKAATQIAMYALTFFLYPANTAVYFALTDILGTFLTALGVSDGWSLIILIFIQCVDIVALSRGRFKFVQGFESNYYAEIWDTIAGLVSADEITRIGSQFFFPQSGLPTYEQ